MFTSDILGYKWEKRTTVFSMLLDSIMIEARVGGASPSDLPVGARGQYSGAKYKGEVLDSNVSLFARLGVTMESLDSLLKKVNEESKESVKVMQESFNQVLATHEMLLPKFSEMINKIRQSRMTVTTELKQSLSIMKDVRKFFLESDYKTEMDRLEKFVLLGERMKSLIDDGTMDAVCDVVLKLAIGDEE